MSMVIFGGGGKPIFDHGKAHGWLQLSADGGPAAQAIDKHLCSHTMDVGGLCVSGDLSIRFYVFDDDCQQISGVTGLVHPGANQIDYGGVRGKCVCFVSLNTSMLALHGADGRKQAKGAAEELAHSAPSIVKFSKGEVDGAHADLVARRVGRHGGRQ